MAKQQNGYLGGYSGRLGPVVGYLWRGKWCLRAKPGKVRNPRTDRQQSHRHLFKAMVQFASRQSQVLSKTWSSSGTKLAETACATMTPPKPTSSSSALPPAPSPHDVTSSWNALPANHLSLRGTVPFDGKSNQRGQSPLMSKRIDGDSPL